MGEAVRRALLAVAAVLVLATAAQAAIAVDATAHTTAYTAGLASLSWTHTVGAGSNMVLVVTVESSSVGTPLAVTASYNGVAMTNIVSQTDATDAAEVDMFYLVAPASGAHTVSVTIPNGNVEAGGSISLSGANQTTPIDAHASSNKTSSASASQSITTLTASDYLVDGVEQHAGATLTKNSAQTIYQTAVINSGAAEAAAGSYKSVGAAGAYTMSWTSSGTSTWTVGVVAVAPAAAGGGCTAPPGQRLMVGVGNCKGD